MGCGLPRGTGDGIGCPKESGQYGDAVALAQEYARGPECACIDGDTIVDSPRYHAFVVAHLERAGFCAFFDGEEIAVKWANTFSEQWDIESAGRRVIRMYAATCRPAWSAIPPSGAPQPNPTPDPTPSPCVPQPDRTDCTAGCALFWEDALTRKASGGAPCEWHPDDRMPGLLIQHEHDVMTPCPSAFCCDWRPTQADLGKLRRALDRQCNVLQMPGRNLVHRPDSGYIPNLCVTVPGEPCPTPTPNPGPTPQPGPSPAVCPAFACLHVSLHHCLNAASQTVPQPVVGGKCHLDVTPLFSRCNSSGRCNAEQCNPEHDFCACGVWPNWRRCESPDGYCWRQTVGPRVRWLVDDVEGGTKGWKATLDKLEPGTYVVEAFTCDQRDAEGVPVPGSGDGRVTFEVR